MDGNRSMKTCIYTCVTGNYDNLNPFPSQDPDIDFICFTDNPNLSFSDTNWDIRPIPNELLHLSKVKQQRCVKILPHRYLKDYDVSLWVDGNLQILKDLKGFISQYPLNEDIFFYTRKHPSRDCAYKEASAVLKMKKDIPAIVNEQMNQYKKDGFPCKYGLEETNVILRLHNSLKCQILDNLWAEQILRKSHRDQLSFDYCRWKTDVNIGFLQTKRLDKDDTFRIKRHGNG